MIQGQWPRKVKYEGELAPNFAAEVAEKACGEKFFSCIQCGTCSGTCPVSGYMDYTPRRIIAMTRAGFKDEVLKSRTIWLCSSCYSCTVECPKEIKITDVMYALKQKAIEEGVYPKRFVIPVMAREFFSGVLRLGRNNEMPLIVLMYLKSNPLLLIKQAFLGLNLFLKGRMGLKLERVETRPGGKGDLKRLLDAVGSRK